MIYIPWKSGILATFTALHFSISVLAAPPTITIATLDAVQTTMIDDHDTRIAYTSPNDWRQDPLTQAEYLFYDNTRSYTHTPGASASLSFTGQ